MRLDGLLKSRLAVNRSVTGQAFTIGNPSQTKLKRRFLLSGSSCGSALNSITSLTRRKMERLAEARSRLLSLSRQWLLMLPPRNRDCF